MIAAFAKAVAQLADPAVRGVLWIGVAIAVAVFAALWTAVYALLTGTETFAWAWLERAFDFLGGVAAVALTWLLFPGVISAATALLLERVAKAVERRHYPELGPAAGVPATAALVAAVRFLAITLGLNIVLLPFLLIPPVFPFVFYGVKRLSSGARVLRTGRAPPPRRKGSPSAQAGASRTADSGRRAGCRSSHHPGGQPGGAGGGHGGNGAPVRSLAAGADAMTPPGNAMRARIQPRDARVALRT